MAARLLHELVRPPPLRARPRPRAPDDVRHFVATALGDAGTNIATISARLGHQDKATTLNIYSHAFSAADAEAGVLMGIPRQATLA